MKRLKELRVSRGYSQKDLADMLNKTQQTIGRWEAGAIEPGHKSMRDLAVIFGVSVDYLMGGVSPSPVPSPVHHFFASSDTDGFWGHIGIQLDGQDHPMWFPITIGNAGRIRGALDAALELFTIETLDNRLIILRPESVLKIWLLDDACDWPNSDWPQPAHYEGRSPEIYRALDKLAECDPEWLKAIAALIPEYEHDGALVSGNPSEWEAAATELASMAFEGDASLPFVAAVLQSYSEAGLATADDELQAYLHDTTVYLTGGGVHRAQVEPQRLVEIADLVDIQMPPAYWDFSHTGGDAEVYIPATRISAVVMPLLDVQDARAADEVANDEDDED